MDDTLKDEVMANEEQRVYIDILKQALETKMDSIGMWDLLASFAESNNSDSIDIFAELSNMKRQFDHHWKEMLQKDADIMDLEG